MKPNSTCKHFTDIICTVKRPISLKFEVSISVQHHTHLRGTVLRITTRVQWTHCRTYTHTHTHTTTDQLREIDVTASPGKTNG